MSESDTTEELLEGTSMRRLVIRLGIPAMFGQFFNILYNIVDRTFIGRIPETGGIALASIGVCAPAVTALSAFAFMVGIAGAAWRTVIAQCCMMLYVIWFLRGRLVPVRLCLCRMQGKIICKILSIGCMSFLITILDNLIIILLNASLRKYGGDTQGDLLLTCAAVIQSFMTIVFCRCFWISGIFSVPEPYRMQWELRSVSCCFSV